MERRLKKNQVISKDCFLDWALQLAKAVQYLHEEHGILHSELVPKNFICRKVSNELVICDFGTAKILGPDGVVHKGTKVYWNIKT